MVIFNSYVKLPEGIFPYLSRSFQIFPAPHMSPEIHGQLLGSSVGFLEELDLTRRTLVNLGQVFQGAYLDLQIL
jgi:hypothetical protein